METTKTKCLVTGATGYLGSVLLPLLHEKGYDVTSLAMPGDNTAFVAQYSAVRFANVCDANALERHATGFDIVIHLAGIVDVGAGGHAQMKRVNVDGTRNVAELCRCHSMKMLYCSSVHAIPCLPGSAVMRETADFNPAGVKGAYAKTKAEATGIVMEMAGRGLDVMTAFPSGIIGPCERKISNIGQLIADFLCGGLTAYIDGKYNFVDVRDVADGICRMMEQWQPGECYILSGHEMSVKEMIAAIAQASGKQMLRVRLPYRFAMLTSYFAEFYYFLLRKKPLYSHYSLQTLHSNCHFANDKARKRIGFFARLPHESLHDMTGWIMAHFVEKKGGRYKHCFFRE